MPICRPSPHHIHTSLIKSQLKSLYITIEGSSAINIRSWFAPRTCGEWLKRRLKKRRLQANCPHYTNSGAHGFALHKGDLRDTLCLSYGWNLPNLPSLCICGQHLQLSCPHGGFMFVWQNELRNISAQLEEEVCFDVGLSLKKKNLLQKRCCAIRLASTEDGARLDVVATNFWGKQ